MADPIFGICLTLADMTASVSGLGTWNAGAGTYSVTLPAKGTCGGAGGGDSGLLQLTCKACGKLRISCTATGYTYNALSASALAFPTFGGIVVSLSSPGGGSPTNFCATGAMTGTNTGDVNVDCGTVINLQFARTSQTNLGSISATFTVAIL